MSRLNSILPGEKAGTQLRGVSLSIRREAWETKWKKKSARQCSCHPQKLVMRKVVESIF